MAVTAANRTAGNSSTDATSYTTVSVTNTANTLLLLAVLSSRADPNDPSAPSITGLSLTWVQVNTQLFATTAGQHRRTTVFRALGASATGTILIDFGAETQSGCAWALDEFGNVDTGGTNGSGAVAQSVPDLVTVAATSLTITLAAFGSADNATYGAAGRYGTAGTTPGSGFTELSDQGGTVPANFLDTEWQVGNDTTVDWSTAASNEWGGVAIEIKMAAAAGGWGLLLGLGNNRLVVTA